MKSYPFLLMSVFLIAGQIRAQKRPVLTIELDAQMRPIIGVTGEVGATYVVESKTDLIEGLWLTRGVVEMVGAIGQWVDEAPATVAQRFYRAVKPDAAAKMVWILPGTFTMGSPTSERNRSDDEGPQTVVTLTKGFWFGKYEVTQGEYLAVMGTNPSFFTGDLDAPVEQVTWYKAVEYCDRLTEQERAAGRLPAGYEYRLPTEAQWEYACRAGTTTRFSFGDALECNDDCGSCSIANQYMWWCENSAHQTHRVGQKLPNAWGLYDMHGNVWEWCLDWYESSLPGGSVSDPVGPSSGSLRVQRGGSYYQGARHGRSAFRGNFWPDHRYHDLGFRAVLVAVP